MKAIIVIAFLLLLTIFSKSALAVTVNIVNYPTTITGDPFTLTASVSGAATGTNYLRVDLYKDGTSNYFGETYNGSDWYNGSDGLQYFSTPVVKGSTASATIQGRIGNPSVTDFTGNGTYKLRLRRYTTSGSPGSGDTMSSVDVAVNLPPTLTPTPTSTPTPTPTTTTPTSTKTPTPAASPTISVSPSEIPIDILAESTHSATLSSDITETPQISEEPAKNKSKVLGTETNNLSKFLIGFGVLLLIACGILTIRTYRKNKGEIKSL